MAKWRLRSQKLDDLANMPEMTDPVQIKVIQLLIVQACAAALLNPRIMYVHHIENWQSYH